MRWKLSVITKLSQVKRYKVNFNRSKLANTEDVKEEKRGTDLLASPNVLFSSKIAHCLHPPCEVPSISACVFEKRVGRNIVEKTER